MISLDLAGILVTAVTALMTHVVDPLMALLGSGAGLLASVLGNVLTVVGGVL